MVCQSLEKSLMDQKDISSSLTLDNQMAQRSQIKAIANYVGVIFYMYAYVFI